jgi:hypothetical protein
MCLVQSHALPDSHLQGARTILAHDPEFKSNTHIEDGTSDYGW